MGPGGEVGFCKNCEYYKDDSNTFSDQKDVYVNKIENECRLLDDIVKKVRKEKGDVEDIIQVVLRLRDADYFLSAIPYGKNGGKGKWQELRPTRSMK